MKLNLGCGKDYRVGWLNIDIDPSVKPDERYDIRDLCRFLWLTPVFLRRHFEDILLNHVFEHLTFREGEVMLFRLHTLLDKDGILEIAVPDLPQAMKEYLEGKHNPLEAPPIERIYGNQCTCYEVHKSGYSKESLTELLTKYGFTITEDLSTQTEIRFKCKKLERVDERV